MRQYLVNKFDIEKEIGVERLTLREIYKYAEGKEYRIVAMDDNWVVFEDLRDFKAQLGCIAQEVHNVAKHFKSER